jgi:5'-3' exoribonuclease 2
MVGKQHKVEQLKQSMTQRSATPNQFIRLDVFGPLPYAYLASSCYFITFINDYSRKTWTYFMKIKSETFGVFKKFKSPV